MTAAKGSVLVVGAGPTGLLLTAELERRGVPVHLIDSLPASLHWDRATVIHPRSLQILKSLPAVVERDARQRFVAAGRVRHRAAAMPAVAIDEGDTLARRRGGQRCRRAFQC